MIRVRRSAAGLVAIFLLFCGVAYAAPADSRPLRKVAILLFDGVEIIDYTGPYEVFGAEDGFEVYTVAATHAPITTSMGMKVVPKYSFADAPAPGVLVVPGGDVSKVDKDPATLDWVRRQTAHAEHVMSVCNGAFTLANAGLLEGLKSTTTSGNIDTLRRLHPEIQVVRDQRVVDNGKIITTGGLSAGIDGALHVVSVTFGEGEARSIAQMLEYDWRPEGGFLPAMFASHVLPPVGDKLGVAGHWETVVSTKGDADRWEIVWRVRSALSPADFIKQVSEIYAAAGHWTSIEGGSAGTRWTLIDSDGKPWNATLSLDGSDEQRLFKIDIARAG
jgi:putative intracellular protease/amidase